MLLIRKKSGLSQDACVVLSSESPNWSSSRIRRRIDVIVLRNGPFGQFLHLPSMFCNQYLLIWSWQLCRTIRLSLQAFFVDDMHCIALMHANWRFVIYDEEEDRPRLLVNILFFSSFATDPKMFRFGFSNHQLWCLGLLLLSELSLVKESSCVRRCCSSSWTQVLRRIP